MVVPEVPGLRDPGAAGHPVAVITQDGHQPRAAQGRVQRAEVHDMCYLKQCDKCDMLRGCGDCLEAGGGLAWV